MLAEENSQPKPSFIERVKAWLGGKVREFEEWGAGVIYDYEDRDVPRWLDYLLKALSFLFKGAVLGRLWLYQKQLMRTRRLGCFVVVVGNLTLGGTGKTPMVEKVARSLQARGRKVAILSRGYKSKSDPVYMRFWRWLTHQKAPLPRVVSDGSQVFLGSELAGDEPYMLAKNLPGVRVVVDRDRVKAGHYAVEKLGADTLILDDGYQYLRMKGWLNLLLIDQTNPFGNGYLLPRGILREPLSQIRRASYVFVTKCQGKIDESLEVQIREYYPDKEIIQCAHAPKHFIAWPSGQEEELTWLSGKKIGVCSGIASPEGFEKALNNMGGELIATKRFLDHHRFSIEELEGFYHEVQAAGAEWVIMTEKDVVRFPEGWRTPLPTYYLRLELEFIEGEQGFEQAIQSICYPEASYQLQGRK